CHPDQFREWSGSMHAYAGEDPVFIAMNKRMQREAPEMASFCVTCHAPLALRTGATKDGLNLDTVAPQLKGVTCFFCHSFDSIQGPFHNNFLKLATDGVLRAGIRDPIAGAPHGASYSAFIDGENEASVMPCGPCHDIDTPAGVQLERTFREWQTS